MSDATTSTRVYLLRHARSGWATPGMRDFDRTLDDHGRTAARRLGDAMQRRQYRPDVVLCSSAARCVETWEGIRHGLPETDATFTDALYSNDQAVYVDLIRAHAGRVSIMLIGHNPMTENTLALLLTDRTAEEDARLRKGFPTAGLAVVDLLGPLSGAATKPARLVDFIKPGKT